MSPHPRNIRALDGIRGIAIVLVMLHHFEVVLPSSGPVMRFIRSLFYFGWSGVDLFFALSGFLITGILLDTRKAANYFSAFYARRILRIFPLYYSVLILILGIASFINPRPRIVPLAADQKLYFFYLTNWLALWKGTWGPNILGHFWSLAVEEQFYLIWPLLVWFLVPARLARLAVAGCIGALISRVYWVLHAGLSQALVIATLTRMDALLCGALAAIVFHRSGFIFSALQKWLPSIAFLALVAFVGGVLVPGLYGGPMFFVETFGFSLLAIGFSAFVLHASATDGTQNRLQQILRSRVLASFGKYSYGIYVFHVPVLLTCDLLVYERLPKAMRINPLFAAAYLVFLFATSFIIAKISYEYFESYFLGLKRYFEPRTSAVPGAAVTVEAN